MSTIKELKYRPEIIQKLYKSGLSVREITVLTNCSKYFVKKDLGNPLPKRPKKEKDIYQNILFQYVQTYKQTWDSNNLDDIINDILYQYLKVEQILKKIENFVKTINFFLEPEETNEHYFLRDIINLCENISEENEFSIWTKTCQKIKEKPLKKCPKNEESLEKLVLTQVRTVVQEQYIKKLLLYMNPKETTQKLLKNVSKREREILIKSYGLLGNIKEPMTEQATKRNLSHSRIHQLKNRGKEKLKTVINELSFNINGKLKKEKTHTTM